MKSISVSIVAILLTNFALAQRKILFDDLVDKNGNRNPKADNLVKFEITGPGSIAGVENANPISVESYQLPQRKAWYGRCLVIIKSGKKSGDIVLKASSPGVNSAEVIIKAK